MSQKSSTRRSTKQNSSLIPSTSKSNTSTPSTYATPLHSPTHAKKVSLAPTTSTIDISDIENEMERELEQHQQETNNQYQRNSDALLQDTYLQFENELAIKFQELKAFELDKLVLQKEAENEMTFFDSASDLAVAMKHANNLDLDQTIHQILMMDDSDDVFGKKAFLKKCSEFDFYTFSVTQILERLNSDELKVCHSGLGDKGAIALAESIKVCTANSVYLTQKLKINKSLKRLILCDNAITPNGGEALIRALLQNKSIEHVDLSENRLGYKEYAKDFGTLLSELLKNNNSIKVISLRGNKLGDRHMIAIAEALSENTTLLSLDMSYNEFGVRSGEIWGQVLTSNVFMKQLSLDWNALSNQGSTFLLHGLKGNNTLVQLSLAWNGIADMGAKDLSAVLASNTSLEQFNISHNRISKEGAKKIAAGLKENSVLKSFDISFNPLDVAGVQAIVESVKDNTTLSELNLRSTQHANFEKQASMESLLVQSMNSKLKSV